MARWIPFAMVALALLAVAWALAPFETHGVVFSPGLHKNQPAGRLKHDFFVHETVPAAFLADADTRAANCVALRFGTYMRRNEGTLEVTFAQGDKGHRWQVDMAKLEDNAYVDFCLDSPIETDQPFRVGVRGIDGTADRSATVWLTAAGGRALIVNGEARPGWGLVLRLTRSREVRPADLPGIDGGAFLAGVLASLAIAGLLLAAVFVRSDSSLRMPPLR